ncbi:hydantoinase B/oxoprolinase family protein [Nonomuraea sp. KC401]|uniref:hydantoinase B/oxoprolinase family protein n=1 Tax=unclassified Nonomuraea TaxID=2593643 RepID=UPI0010FDB308|nr:MULTISPECIES: hydantoinase B/oxoprolinase family protein [unclassified Nonomuraea]NBE96698.1 hydantoinase B/oxoprolinase family protein [Nonomuraea sp. K271]TLF63112.1 hydantoinase B/oxoprolinase family protein [Nonomuraea sp. KC401]
MTDPLTAEVLRNALVVAAEEASIVVVRAAYSTFIVEGSDASAAVLDAGGRLIAQSMATTLMNSMALRTALPELVKDFPLETMRPGEVYALNDAYRGGVHTNDLLVYRPVFVHDVPAYFTATMIHVSDLGGLSAGGMAPLATDIFLEGLRLPPVRLATEVGIDPAMEAVLKANSRTPDKVMGDVRALVAGTAVAAARLERLIGEYGEQGLADGVDAYLDHTEAVTRAALAELPRGRFEASYPIDDDGMNPEKPHLVRVAVTLGFQRAVLDFAGTGPQVPAAINASASQSLAAAVFALRCFLDPSIPMNDGCLRAIDVRLPEGSLLNARSPYPCGGRYVPIYAAMEAVFQAMSDAVPERAIAASGILQPFSIAAVDAPYWIHLSYDFGGVGARQDLDGPDATGVHFGIGRNSVPQAEPVESRCPLIVESVETIPDSGGPGRHRGGLGSRTVYRFLAGCHVTTRGDRLRLAPPGRDGGLPGRLGGFFKRHRDGTVERLASKVNNVRFAAGEAFIVETTGGGGIGPPGERDRQAILGDLEAGRVTPRGAAEDYGFSL